MVLWVVRQYSLGYSGTHHDEWLWNTSYHLQDCMASQPIRLTDIFAAARTSNLK
jgi:hypothetical protein